MKSIKKFTVLIICLIGINARSVAQGQITNIEHPHVIHVVLFRFSNQADSSHIGQLMAHIRSLKSTIPGILGLSFGKNFSQRAKGYTNAVTITFIDQEALNKFIVNPLHQQLIKNDIKPILADMIVVDYVDNANL